MAHPRPRAATRVTMAPIAPRRRLLVGALAGAEMGLLVGGIGARAAMRLIALGQDRAPAFTVRGSLVVVFAGTLIGAIVGAAYVAVRRFIPGRGVVRGLLYSLGLQLLGLLIGFPLPVRPPGGSFVAGDVIARVVFAGLLLAGGGVLELLVSWHETRGATLAGGA